MRISQLQRNILRVLASVGQPGLRVGQIAAAVKRPHSTVSRSLKQLEVGGYTDRENASVKIAVPGMDLVREDLRPVAEAVASIAASYQGLHSIGYRHLKNFSLIRDAAEQYRRNFNVIAESAQQYHSQIQQTFRIFAETGQALQKTYAGVTRLASISKDLHVIGQAMQVAVRRIEETFRTLRPFLIELAKLPAANRAVQGKLLPRGWLVSPTLPVGDFLWIYRELETHQLEVAESNLVDHFEERIQELIEETYEYQPFRKRKHLLDQALRAHQRSEYGLAIPVFLSALEGVVIESFADDKLFARRDRWIRRVSVDNLMEAFCEAFWTTMVDILWKSYGLKDEPPSQALNRHLILHGRSVDYDTKRNSVQVVLALNYLAFVIGEHIKRTSAA